MAGDAELCGFLDAKLPGSRYAMSQRVRKRPLASPWKAWRRHWCSVRKLGPGLGLEVQLDRGIVNCDGINATNTCDRNNSIKVPSDSIICRTESRTKQFAFGIFPGSTKERRKPLLYLCGTSESETQRWMANLRQLLKPRRHRFMEGTFNISMVDNTHSRTAGLSGIYGDLVASRSGVFIKDVHTGDIIENLDWKEMRDFHLITAGRPEDVKRICVIHTTKEFRGGIGELHIFCMNASQLLQDLVTQGRGPKHKHIQTTTRPLSLSEGDLRIEIHRGHGNGGGGTGHDDSQIFPVLKNKVASTLINASRLGGMLLSSRSGSEVKLLHHQGEIDDNGKFTGHLRAIDNVYQCEPAAGTAGMTNISMSLEELETPPSPRRISTISIASGIYEEIVDDFSRSMRIHSNLYEDPNEIIIATEGMKRIPPPPLPPRKRRNGSNFRRHDSVSDDGLDSEGGTRSATPTPEEKNSIVSNHSNVVNAAAASVAMDTSDYVPMSPRVKDIAHQLQEEKQSAQEEVYMVMR